MKKTAITISCDEEKVTATRLYMKDKNQKLEEELVKAMEVLYTKTVPLVVRTFIDMRNGMVIEHSAQKISGRKE